MQKKFTFHFENSEEKNRSLNHVLLKLRHLCHGLLRFQVHCRPETRFEKKDEKIMFFFID